MAKIKKIIAYEILNSSGMPTIEGKLYLDNNSIVVTSIPSGVSVSANEAFQLRDNDKNYFDGKGVFKSLYYINNLIAPKLIGVTPEKQIEIDNWLIKADGTKKKEILGANTILLISQLIAKAAAVSSGIPLFQYLNSLYEKINKEKILIKKIPSPIFNLISGGIHSYGNLDFQEYLIIPSSANNFSQSLIIGATIYNFLKKILEYHNVNVCYSFQNTYSPNLSTNIDALEIIVEAIIKKQFKIGLDVFLGIDFAADFICNDNLYRLKDYQYQLSPERYLDYISKLIKKYQLFYVEDPLNSNDWPSWKKLNNQFNQETYICGDDLISSNKELLIKAIKENVLNSIVVKPSQVGTVTETMQIINLAKKNNLSVVISHRSQETNDNFIADLALAVQADFIKFGPPAGGERIVKYNYLRELEASINIFQKKI